MIDDGQHGACVEGWLQLRAAKDLPPDRMLSLFEAAVRALWARTTTVVGDVTLTAIADRVLYNTAERFPLFSSLSMQSDGAIQVRKPRDLLSLSHGAGLLEACRFFLVEFLTVLGHLTAEILTPDLHAELVKVTGDTTGGTPAPPSQSTQPGVPANEDQGP